jgi:alanine racemase
VAANYRGVRERVGDGVRVLAVVKADAYGHGAVAVARKLEAEGAFGFGVGDAAEAMELRAAGVRAPILVLGAIVPKEVPDVVREGVSVSLFSKAMARLLDREARARGARVEVHLKADTGMGRLGAPPEKLAGVARFAAGLPGIRIAGAFTHCPASDEELVNGQRRVFRGLLEALEREGISPPLRHMANSQVLHFHPAAHFDMVRPGICLYGVDPGNLRRAGAILKPALSLRTQIVYLKDVPAGTFVGYRPGYKTYSATKIATLPVGYADGYCTLLSGRVRVLVRGLEAPLAGRVSMDYTTIDVGHVPGVKEGDTVTLLGTDGSHSITANDLAAAMNVIPYEILTMLASRRVVRKHLP